MPARSHSLSVRVPLYIAVGLTVVLATYTWIAYNNVRAASAQVGEQHLTAVASQFASSYQTRVPAMIRQMHAAAATKQFVDFARTGAGRDTVVSLLRRITTSSTTPRAELIALNGRPLLAAADSAILDAPEGHAELADEFTAALKGADHSVLAPLRLIDGEVMMPVVSAIFVDSQPAAYLVVWVKTSTTDQARQAVSGIIGAGAKAYIGNARDDLWSDFSKTPHKFSQPIGADSTIEHYLGDDGSPVTATTRRIPGSPWAIRIEFANGAMLAPATDFLKRSVLLSLLLLVVATTAMVLFSRHVFTQPLRDLTVAAKAMATGDYTGRVAATRDDELGVLATSFNAMVDNVREAHADLEHKVEVRTKLLTERNEELEAFAHSVSHDLRSPLRAMHGFSQALIEDHSDELDPTARDYVLRIAAAAKRMDALTQDLLTYSRVSRQEVALAPVQLDHVAKDAVAQVEADVAAHGGTVHVQEPMPRVMAHRPMLEQAFANLVSNGVKFVAPGVAPDVRLKAERANGVVRVWVEDNGIGIEQQHLGRIFSVFERLHGTDQYPGTGIGLAIVRKAIERMGGRVGVVSALGAGSKFWIELPSAEEG